MCDIPDLMTTAAGAAVADARQWAELRRPELLELFSREVFGRTPSFDTVTWEDRDDGPALGGRAMRRTATITYGKGGRTGSFTAHLLLPAGVAKPPAIVLGVGRWYEVDLADPTAMSPYWPVEAIIARGFATALFYFGEVDTDEDDGCQSGVHAVLAQPRRPDSWGALGAWAWGFSRVVDWLAAGGLVDAGRIGAIGHSRGGKAALWAAAQDERIALAGSNCSGCTGAALSRTTTGEKVADILRVFPYWFCENYKKYAENTGALPLDQHMLLALAAPRRLYVVSATEDDWAGPAAEYQGTVLAARAWTLFGEEPMAARDPLAPPAPDAPVFGRRVGYHLRTGRHVLAEYDWQRYMDFMEEG